jgi:hypothetical protein
MTRIAIAAALLVSAARTEPSPGPIDSSISFVETGGLWENSAQRGHYRLVVQTRCSPEHCHDRLFVQWVMELPSERVAATKYVAEVGDLTNLDQVHFVLGGVATRIEVHHHVEGIDEKWTRCLVLAAPGKFTASEGACSVH